MKVKKIYSKKVFQELMSTGRHNFLNTQDNLKHKGFKVFVFEQTEELLKDLTMITLKHKR